MQHVDNAGCKQVMAATHSLYLSLQVDEYFSANFCYIAFVAFLVFIVFKCHFESFVLTFS